MNRILQSAILCVGFLIGSFVFLAPSNAIDDSEFDEYFCESINDPVMRQSTLFRLLEKDLKENGFIDRPFVDMGIPESLNNTMETFFECPNEYSIRDFITQIVNTLTHSSVEHPVPLERKAELERHIKGLYSNN